MNEYYTIQYQAVAEPVSTEAGAAVPSMDGWFVETQQPYSLLVPAQQPDAFTYAPATGQFPIPELSWEPTYPNHIDDVPQLQYLHEWLFYVPALGEFPAPELSWSPVYPDYVNDVPQLQYLYEWVFQKPGIKFVIPPLDSWLSVYPDYLPRTDVPAHDHRSAVSSFVIPDAPIAGPCSPVGAISGLVACDPIGPA